MDFGMRHWMTRDGTYYMSDRRILENDIEIGQPRPSENHNFVNGQWVPRHQPDIGIYRMRLNDDAYHPVPEHQIAQRRPTCEECNTRVERTQEMSSDDKKGVVLNNDTRVMFGVKELMMVGAFVITATISWQDTNSRIIKLEESKAVSELSSKVQMLESELRTQEKQHRTDMQKMEQTIRELEQVVFATPRGNRSSKE